jgi:hypothetical protein
MFDVEAFAAKARSALYLAQDERRPLPTREAFFRAAQEYPAAGKLWIEALGNFSDPEISRLVDLVPPQLLSESSAEFAKRVIFANKRALLTTMEAL